MKVCIRNNRGEIDECRMQTKEKVGFKIWPFVCDEVKQGMLDCDATQIKHTKTHKRMLHVNSI